MSDAKSDYLHSMRERGKKNRIYRDYQLIGLEVAAILEDTPHKALYIKLAKQFGKEKVLMVAKDVAERANVKNKGAYFMRLLHAPHKNS